MQSLGGRDANDLVAWCVASVIQRPELAQYFNCGGTAKGGTVIRQAMRKENFMGTHTQKTLLCMYIDQRKYDNYQDDWKHQSVNVKRLNNSLELKKGFHHKTEPILDVDIP